MERSVSSRTWTVAEARAKLSEVLRLAEEEGPQRIGLRRPFVVVPAASWEARQARDKHLGRWLIENLPRGLNWDIPRDRRSNRPISFSEEYERCRDSSWTQTSFSK